MFVHVHECISVLVALLCSYLSVTHGNKHFRHNIMHSYLANGLPDQNYIDNYVVS